MTPDLTEQSMLEDISSSPSQIPDSQPSTPVTSKPQVNNDLLISPSLVSHREPSTAAPALATPTIFQSATRPPRAVSLEPLELTPQSSSPTESSTSPDRRPEKYPLFTSTPISKPLKSFLTEEVPSPLPGPYPHTIPPKYLLQISDLTGPPRHLLPNAQNKQQPNPPRPLVPLNPLPPLPLPQQAPNPRPPRLGKGTLESRSESLARGRETRVLEENEEGSAERAVWLDLCFI